MASFGHLFQMGRKKKKERIDDLGRRVNIPPSLLESPPLQVVEKTLHIRVCPNGPYLGRMNWYVIKVSSNDPSSSGGWKRKRGTGDTKVKITKIKPISKKAETPWWSCCVALGSTIYSIGGGEEYKDSSQTVRATDAVCVGRRRQWRHVFQMEARRTRALAVAVDDKIYVFGGLREINDGPEIEVFDPVKKMAERVKEPPVSFKFNYLLFFATYDEASKKIILGSFLSGVLLSYDVTKGGGGGGSEADDDPWEVLDTQFVQMRTASRVLLFDNGLYWIGIGYEGVVDLVFYDMDLKMSVCTPIIGFDHIFYFEGSYYKPPLFHFRGNEFYLIWLDKMGELGVKVNSLIRCTRILVSKRVDKRKKSIRLRAYALTTKNYQLPERIYFMDAVVLEGTSSYKEVDKQEDTFLANIDLII